MTYSFCPSVENWRVSIIYDTAVNIIVYSFDLCSKVISKVKCFHCFFHKFPFHIIKGCFIINKCFPIRVYSILLGFNRVMYCAYVITDYYVSNFRFYETPFQSPIVYVRQFFSIFISIFLMYIPHICHLLTIEHWTSIGSGLCQCSCLQLGLVIWICCLSYLFTLYNRNNNMKTNLT